MAEPTELRPLKRSMPPDLQKQVEDIQTKVPRTTGPPGDLNEEKKRWLIVGICLHSIISPLLRRYIDPIVSKLYNSLISSSAIDTQSFHNYLNKYPATNSYFLNYESINNNRNVPKTKMYNKWVNDYQKYDYKITSHVDLSKLFLQPNMAHYSAIDASCDLSALLGIVINISTFPRAVQSDAEKIRSDIRNPWAHCAFTEWTTAKYRDSFDLMGQFVRDFGLSNREENKILGELNTWATNGINFFNGTVLGLEIVEEISQQTYVLSEYVQTLCTETDSQFIKVKKELKDLENSLQERIRNLENKIKEHEVELKACGEQTTSVSRKIEHLEVEIKKQEDNIPINIMDQHNQDIKDWENDESTFLETRATNHILISLPSNDCIIVTGSSGCGKSSNIHHAALHLRDRYGYVIIPILTGPIDIINYYNENKKQVFVVDDICGKESINIQTLRNWRDNSERLEKIFKTVENETNSTVSQISGSKLMISCRLHIYKEEQFQLVRLLTRKECNLLSPDMCLLQEERKLMLQKYLPNAIIDSVMKVEENVDFFPLLCKMSKTKTYVEVIKLFTASLDSIKKSIINIILESNDQCCALVLCILFDDGFNTNWLNLKSAPEKKKEKLENIVKEFKIDLYIESSRNALISGFYTLDGTYLKQRGTEYSMIHDKIHEMAAVICGQRRPECFIKYSSSLSIRDHFIFKSVMEVQPTDDVIVLSKDTEEEYFERLFSDLKEFIIISTFHNKQLIYQPFRDKLISFLGKRDGAEKLLKMFDQKKSIEIMDGKIVGCLEPTKFTTPLIESASCGYYDIVHFLIDTVECNVNLTDRTNRSPLYKASEGGKTEVVKLLCENNASVSQCNMFGQSPLYVACEGGHTDTVNLLLQNKADMSHGRAFGTCPLYVACAGGYFAIVKLLLQNNTDVLQPYIFGWSFMECVQGHIYTVKLSQNKKLNARQKRNNYIHQRDQRRESPLYVACKGGYIETVKLLLQYNYDVSMDKIGKTPLYAACEGGHTEIVKVLLNKKADISQGGSLGNLSKLLVACAAGHTDIVKLLLHRKDYVGQFNQNELLLSLFFACRNGHTEIVEQLLIINVNIYDTLSIQRETPLFMACASGHTNTVNLLLQNKADVSQCNINGVSPLHTACQGGYTDTAELLLQNNADLSKCNDSGESPLYVACRGGHVSTVKLLLQNNASVSQCDKHKGWSPLHVVCDKDSLKYHLNCYPYDKMESEYEKKYTDHIEIVKLLITGNVDVNLCNKEAQTPLDIAHQSEFSEIVRLLEDIPGLKTPQLK